MVEDAEFFLGVLSLSDGLFSRRFRIGKYLGINLFVHWTFFLLVAYVFLSSLGEGSQTAFFMLAQLLGVFFCVTLHEYGHAMAARRFGIGTADITLLPIGGVARLHRMPRVPWQEMVVALAGPAVNVVIVIALSLIFATRVSEEMLIGFRDLAAGPTQGLEMSQDVATAIDTMFRFPSIAGYLFTMIMVNIMLVLFNLIPAFPMDGGRVLRSFIAMFTNYTVATKFAFRVGVVFAAIMILFSIQGPKTNPVAVFIALFVAFAGYTEFKQVELSETLRGSSVADAMIRTKIMAFEDMRLCDLAMLWQKMPTGYMPVVNSMMQPVGIIELKEFVRHLKKKRASEETISNLVQSHGTLRCVEQSELLENALPKLARHRRQHLVVDEGGLFVGVIDLDTMVHRIRLPDDECLPISLDPISSFDQKQ